MDSSAPQRVGSYLLMGELARGGLATVHVGRRCASGDFQATVAIKRLLAEVRGDPEIRAMLLDEARLSSRVHHPNVLACIDVVEEVDELLLVMPFVDGVSLAEVLAETERRGEKWPVDVACRIVHDVLLGLHAAHTATDASGAPLGLVHRDVSPQNVLVGADGIARVLDFGIAKARGKLHHTRDGIVRGKLRYMAPEQLRGEPLSAAADQWSAACVLWELLAGRPLRDAANESALWLQALNEPVPPIRTIVEGAPPVLDEVLGHALARDPAARHPSAKEMAQELEAAVDLAGTARVAEHLERVAGPRLAERIGVREAAERTATAQPSPPPAMPSSRSRSRVLAASLFALGFGGVVAIAWAAGSSRAAQPSVDVTTSPPVAIPSTSATATEPASSVAQPEPEPSAAPEPSSSVAKRVGRPRRGRCDPPYILDDAGRKIFKVECVRE